MYYWTNPYFDPEPWIYPLVSRFSGFIGISITIFTLYCILTKSPKEVTQLYKGLLIYSQMSFLFTQTVISIGAIPVVMFPYSAFYSLGLFAFLKIPVAYHFTAFMWSCVLCGSSMMALFFYKADALIPHGHLLRILSNFWRIPIYFVTFIISPIAPPISWGVYFSVSNQTEDKQTLANQIGIFTEKLFDDETLALIVTRPSSWVHYVAIAACFLALLGFILIITLCATISFAILHNKRSSMSQRTRQMHKSWLIGHVVQVQVIIVVYGCLLIGLGIASYTEYDRADLANIGAIIYPQTSPICSIILILSSKAYKQHVLKLIGFKKISPERSKIVVVAFGK